MNFVTCTLFGSNYCWDCKRCSERENMPNIKITAEVDGKQVPLENISTETFEAIKALEKQEEIPVARVGYYHGDLRLIFKPTKYIELKVGRIYALNPKNGHRTNDWDIETDDWETTKHYHDVKLL